MPLVVFLWLVISFWVISWCLSSEVFEISFEYFLVSLPIIIVWLFIWILFQRQIVFSFSGAKPITRKQNPEIYNIVENLAISRWLKIPKIWIIEDNSMNAFATWWSKDNSWIVFSRWILNRLDKKEIEAVAAHELTHIINEDVKMMVIITVFIWIIWTIWEILIRTAKHSSRSRNSKWWNPLPIIWIVLYLISILILPLINLAISRKREYLADAGSVELTSDKNAMISALKKISSDSRIETIEKDSVAAMCIASPFKKKDWVFTKIKNLFSTHPTIESRIEFLEKY